jgi:NAD(P)-dependent dehydrogenase (short-subunit alcohol dehydrogenase family)
LREDLVGRVDGKNVLITGAGGAIGAQVVRLFRTEGARVAATDLGPLPDGTADFSAPVDAADPAAFRAYLADATAALGEIDILVNVAGLFRIADFVDSDDEHWAHMLRANLGTALSACHAVLPSMLSRGRGAIVNFASTAGEYGSIRPAAAYAAAKGGVIAFTKSLAREVSPLGVRVNAISPGPVDTPALATATEEQRHEAASRTLLGRLGSPQDIAYGALYLGCDESAFVTGEVLRVNGGSLL